ncbi:MAG: carbamoyl-phosphate synthase large subunit [Proteobacteria bacterium]|nr:carbamoyl-phosphate synthase large subunit [Pseudomonadota bacterium]
MNRLLIANRGEIALRIHRSAKELGISTIGIFSEDDSHALHLSHVNESISLGATGPNAYLDMANLIKIALANKCDAIHPGYGFLSENHQFASKVNSAGLIFIGPTENQLKLFGDKISALKHAEELDIPVLGISEELENHKSLEGFVDKNPNLRVIVKAAGGGGGRGIRVVENSSECKQLFEQARAEAENAFGDNRLYAEQFLKNARHIEVQIIGDGKGGITHLWERDCSLQRRHQKIIEFAPAPSLHSQLRDKLLHCAEKMAHSVNYKGLGTFEFLINTEDNSHYFMEANARLQVEHTVTEVITGQDLVCLQVRVAEGASLDELSLSDAPEIKGSAVQMRVNAEEIDDQGNVLPKGGTLTQFEPPAGLGIRIDTAAYTNYALPSTFDSLLAKIVVSYPSINFEALLRRASRALEEFVIEGTSNNLDLLKVLVEDRNLIQGTLNTTFIDQNAGYLNKAAKSRTSPILMRAGDQSSAKEIIEKPIPGGSNSVLAPMRGSVMEIYVEKNQIVSKGDQLALLEAMKMHHEIKAPFSGRISEIFTTKASIVEESSLLFAIIPDQSKSDVNEVEAQISLEAERADLLEVEKSHNLGKDENRPLAVNKRRKIGSRTARENVEDLCDEGSFFEYGALAIAAQRRRRSLEDLKENTPADGMIAGFGTVNSDHFGEDLSRCAILAYDYTVLAGTQGVINHKKKDRIFELVKRWETPVVFFTEGGGGRPGDVDADELNNSWLDLKTFTTWPQINGVAPRIAVNSGRCFAGNAVIFGCADITIATKNSNIGLAGPAMIEHGGLGKYKPEDIGPIDVQSSNGVVDIACEDEKDATQLARRVLSFFQGKIEGWSCSDQRIMRHLVPEDRKKAYNMRDIIENLADEGSMIELRKDYGFGVFTAFIRIAGEPFGLIANNPLHLGGAIDGDGGEKGGRFLQLCDAFGIPIVSLCDTPGFMVGPDSEKTAAVRRGSRLIVVSANLSVPLFTVIIRKGYGLGSQAMAGGGFHEPFFTIGWPTAEMGPMGLEGAVELGFRKELEATNSSQARQALFEKLVAQMYQKGKAISVAGSFEIDAVIDPKDTREWLTKGLKAAKKEKKYELNKRFIDVW